jgi:DNA processing protein
MMFKEGCMRFYFFIKLEGYHCGSLFLAIRMINQNSSQYPPLLKNISCPPAALYSKGAPLDPFNHYVSIVGTRLPSPYGIRIAEEISTAIAKSGGVIVSGLAFGIDSVCHRTAVACGKPTVAVIASGISNITPASHYNLAMRIIETGGTILSENKNSNPSFKYLYLARNRIIAGMSMHTIVIEAAEKSGALITANLAVEQGRNVYALPGDITRCQSYGCNHLISKGATPIYSVPELIEALGFDYSKSKISDLTPREEKLLLILSRGDMNFDEILQACILNICDLQTVLTQLELKGCIRKNASGKFESLL